MKDIFIDHLEAIADLMKSQLEGARDKGIQVQVRHNFPGNHYRMNPKTSALIFLGDFAGTSKK
jgi:hypothetical protein